MQGHITKWFNERGYGFIKGNDGLHYFCHISQVESGVADLRKGSQATFNIEVTPKGNAAVNVMIMEPQVKDE